MNLFFSLFTAVFYISLNLATYHLTLVQNIGSNTGLALTFLLFSSSFAIAQKVKLKPHLVKTVFLAAGLICLVCSFFFDQVVLYIIKDYSIRPLLWLVLFFLHFVSGYSYHGWHYDKGSFQKNYGFFNYVSTLIVSFVIAIGFYNYGYSLFLIFLCSVYFFFQSSRKTDRSEVMAVFDDDAKLLIVNGLLAATYIMVASKLLESNWYLLGIEFYMFVFFIHVLYGIGASLFHKIAPQVKKILPWVILFQAFLIFIYFFLPLGQYFYSLQNSNHLVQNYMLIYILSCAFYIFVFLLPLIFLGIVTPAVQKDRNQNDGLFWSALGGVFGYLLYCVFTWFSPLEPTYLIYLFSVNLFWLVKEFRSQKMFQVPIFFVNVLVLLCMNAPNGVQNTNIIGSYLYSAGYTVVKQIETLHTEIQEYSQGIDLKILDISRSGKGIIFNGYVAAMDGWFNLITSQRFLELLTPETKKILILGQGNQVYLRPIYSKLKYLGVSDFEITVVERISQFQSPAVTGFYENWMEFPGPLKEVNFVTDDVFHFVLNTKEKFDLVYWNLMDSNFANSNILTSREFYISLGAVIKANGFFSSIVRTNSKVFQCAVKEGIGPVFFHGNYSLEGRAFVMVSSKLGNPGKSFNRLKLDNCATTHLSDNFIRYKNFLEFLNVKEINPYLMMPKMPILLTQRSNLSASNIEILSYNDSDFVFYMKYLMDMGAYTVLVDKVPSGIDLRAIKRPLFVNVFADELSRTLFAQISNQQKNLHEKTFYVDSNDKSAILKYLVMDRYFKHSEDINRCPDFVFYDRNFPVTIPPNCKFRTKDFQLGLYKNQKPTSDRMLLLALQDSVKGELFDPEQDVALQYLRTSGNSFWSRLKWVSAAENKRKIENREPAITLHQRLSGLNADTEFQLFNAANLFAGKYGVEHKTYFEGEFYQAVQNGKLQPQKHNYFTTFSTSKGSANFFGMLGPRVKEYLKGKVINQVNADSSLDLQLGIKRQFPAIVNYLDGYDWLLDQRKVVIIEDFPIEPYFGQLVNYIKGHFQVVESIQSQPLGLMKLDFKKFRPANHVLIFLEQTPREFEILNELDSKELLKILFYPDEIQPVAIKNSIQILFSVPNFEFADGYCNFQNEYFQKFGIIPDFHAYYFYRQLLADIIQVDQLPPVKMAFYTDQYGNISLASEKHLKKCEIPIKGIREIPNISFEELKSRIR